MRLPSEVRFAAFLQYSPRGQDRVARSSRMVRDAVKADSFLPMKRADGTVTQVKAMELFAVRLRERLVEYPFLGDYFGPDVTLIPVPRSAPLRDKGALWPAKRICEELVRVGLGGIVAPVLVRTKAVPKSAWARPGERPGPAEHFESVQMDPAQPLPLGKTGSITVVDDFVTRGATLLGVYPHVREAFEGREVRCFALVRTESFHEITSVYAPVEGLITFGEDGPQRTP